MSRRLLSLLAFALPTALACQPAFDEPLPLVVGATWTYDVTDAVTGETAPKIQTLTEETDEGFVFDTDKAGGGHTTSVVQDLGDALVRLREVSTKADGSADGSEAYEPHKLRVPKTLLNVGATLTDEYTETDTDAAGVETTVDKSEVWALVAIEKLETPAGTFDAALHFQRSGNGTKHYWFVNGVGKVREEGGGTEVLTDFSLP